MLEALFFFHLYQLDHFFIARDRRPNSNGLNTSEENALSHMYEPSLLKYISSLLSALHYLYFLTIFSTLR